MSECMTAAELEKLYYETVLKHDFYGADYGRDWNVGAYHEMATLLAEIIRPRKHVDVGCGKGFLVLAMRQRGIESYGIDFSPALIQQAPQEILPYLTVEKTEDWIDSGAFANAELITYMEVFEHLPLRVCEAVLQILRGSFRGRLFITTPSFGVDERWQLGIVTNKDTPTWQDDMATNIPFRQIVLQNGLPHHGHITLCSYRWWTEFFLFNGWVRSLDLEVKAKKDFGATLKKYNWNPYILEPLSANCFEIGLASTNQLGRGWHEAELMAEPGRWTDGRAEVFLQCRLSALSALTIELKAPDVNAIADYSLMVLVEELILTTNYEFRWEPVLSSHSHSLSRRDKTLKVTIPISSDRAAMSESSQGKQTFRITLLSPSFCPKELGFSADERRLGVFVTNIHFKNSE
jgi:SAM-dependent methyltransferase